MRASDWVRSNFVAGCTLTDAEWQSILDNNQQGDDYCGMTIADAKNLLASGKYFGHMYQYANDRVLISYLDKSSTDRMMWRLAFFSFNPVHVESSVVVDLIIRSLKEMMVEQYFGKVPSKTGLVRGIYYYNEIEDMGKNVLFDRVLSSITKILSNSNMNQFAEFSSEVVGGKVIFYLTYKGA